VQPAAQQTDPEIKREHLVSEAAHFRPCKPRSFWSGAAAAADAPGKDDAIAMARRP